ncbi:MAG: filamentous hemagglutinin N-terminal domain-containing protein, partial [Haliea sp.]
SFSIGAKDQVNIQQQMGASSVLLNRVVNSGPRSEIQGLLSAPGRVYVVNPAGVLFGPTAQVNVGGLVASTLDIAGADQDARNASFMAGGRELSLSGPADGLGAVTVEAGARLNATGIDGRNGVIALVGASVVNRGEINVARGSAGLLAGNQVVVVDPVGDGLTTFRIAPTNSADNARVENVVDGKAAEGVVSGRITADGGRIVMMAGSTNYGATVVNQQGVLQARSLENRNGEIVLGGSGSGGAPNVVAVGGTLDVSAASAGTAGGKITIEGDMLRVQGATLRAGGAANGQVQFTSKADVVVQAAGSNPEIDGTSTIDDQVLGGALSRGADVTLNSKAGNIGDFGGWGVAFGDGAQVVKTEGGSASLTVNSNRNIEMRAGSAIQSKSGALNVNFNADAAGSAAPDAIPLDGQPIPRRGSIVLRDATVESNGGDIRFYGQSDVVNGRAVGDVIQEFPVDLAPTTRRTAGIELDRSTLSTCGVAQGSCTGGGSISLRGEGSTWQATSQFNGKDALSIEGTSGVAIAGSQLRTGAGAIAVEGRAGLGSFFAAGVDISSSFRLDDTGPPVQSRVASATGDVSIVGSARGWTAGDAIGVQMGASNGVAISGGEVATGGNVSIRGSGGDVSAAATDAGFIALVTGAGGGSFHSEGTGVDLNTRIVAGEGRAISIAGTAGSAAFGVNADGSLDTDARPAHAVDMLGGTLQAGGGRIAIDGGTGVVAVGSNSSSLLSVVSTTGAGGSIDIRARNVSIEGGFSEFGTSTSRLDASGVGQGGSINVHAIRADGVPASGILGIDGNVTMAVNGTSPTGNGGSIRVLGDNTLRAYGSFEAKGGVAGGNGGFVETSGGAFDLSGVRVNTAAPAGKAGEWLIDPYDVLIVNGAATGGGLGGNTFVPLADSTLQDGDINAALVNGNVTITTGVGGSQFAGDIEFDDAQIVYTGTADRTFRLDANRSIRGNGATSIAAYDPVAGTPSGRLNVVFNANANNNAAATGGGQVSYDGAIYTNGGDVTMNGNWANPSNQATSVHLGAGSVVDTRRGNQANGAGGYTGGSNALAGGNVTLVGRTSGTPNGAEAQAAVWLDNTVVTTSTGNVGIFGSSTLGSGVQVESTQGIGGVFTTSGNIQITGVGSYTANSATLYGHGVVLGNTAFVTTTGQPTLQTASGNIDVSGLRLAGGTQPGTGLLVGNRALVTTTGGGNISLT